MSPESPPSAKNIADWFPHECQQRYINALIGQSGLTRTQARCFVRLWGYAHLQSGKAVPIPKLDQYPEVFCCSHAEAADLFYCDRNSGTPRAAGMMVDQLVAKHLVTREPFDGVCTRLSLRVPSSFLPSAAPKPAQLRADAFNPRGDAPLVAALLAEGYGSMMPQAEVSSYKMTKVLRQWATQCPDSLRVLRTSEEEPVGISVFFPVHPSCEEQFHLAPSSSLHLSTLNDEDPILVAEPEDLGCCVVFVRGWQIKPQYWSYAAACELLQDAQATLRRMQQAFPNLCDVFTISLDPRQESFALTLGFRPVKADPNSSLRWLYMPLDRVLELDVDETLVEFNFGAG
ncbi:MAG: hypothetical protein ACFB4J_13495 [Elainellaceae cyanobacterium]